MKGINRYVMISICCGLMIMVSIIYLLSKSYTYNELESYIVVSDDYFDDYNKVLLHDKEYATLLEIPMPHKKGILVTFDNDKILSETPVIGVGDKVEIHVKENSTYKLGFLNDSNIIYETIVKDEKTSIDYDTIGGSFNKIMVTALSGQSFGVHFIGVISKNQQSVMNQPLIESGLVRSQLRDLPTSKEEVKELALVEPYEAIGVVAFYDYYNDGYLGIKVLNIHERTITLLGIETKKGKLIANIDHIKIEHNNMETIETSDDLLYKELQLEVEADVNKDNLYLRYYIAGSPKESIVKLNIFSRYSNDLYSETIVNRESNIESFDFVNVEDHIITFEEDYVSIDRIMFIPKEHLLKVKEGQTIDLINGAYISSRSHVEFIGTKENPINILTSDHTGKGIFINQGNSNNISIENSRIEHTIFNGLDTPSSGAFVLTGAVSFYKSDVKISQSQFLNNVSEDSLNIVSSQFSVDSCNFENAPSDCLDGDFSIGDITNSTFINIAGDAIDFSGSTIEVNQCDMTHVLDKAVSGGEKSTVYVNNVTITDAQIGLASKDSSMIFGDNIYMTNTKIGYMLYQKKPEYDGGYMEIKNSEFKDNGGLLYLLQTGSTLYIDNEKINNVERKNQDEIIEKVINGEPIE